MSLRVIFMGTPEFAAATLAALHAAGHDIAAVYTQPPRAGGRRGLELVKSPVHVLAETLGLAVRTPLNFRDPAEVEAFRALHADVAAVVAYGLLLPQEVLDAPKFGCFNGHASALPRWRGAAPIQRAIMAGDASTAMMVMKMEAGLDTGPVALAKTIAIAPDMNSGLLHDALRDAGAALMVEALGKLEAGALTLTPQAPEGVTYAKKITKDETRIDWTRPARELRDHVRGLSPAPGAWCEIAGKPERLKVLRAALADGAGAPGVVLDDRLTIACGEGALRLDEVQRAGGKPMNAREFLRGVRLSRGDRLA